MGTEEGGKSEGWKTTVLRNVFPSVDENRGKLRKTTGEFRGRKALTNKKKKVGRAYGERGVEVGGVARTNVRLVCHGVRLMLAAPTSRVCPATTREVESSLPTRCPPSVSSLTQLRKPIICPAISEFNRGRESERGRWARQRSRPVNFPSEASPRLIVDKPLLLLLGAHENPWNSVSTS